ncbi:cucurbitadienol 11-hydroxylase-like [Mercurialis annua]|uniref:cucurbitadienol 11-hydroxylase-like n=1 Tax=Mercurialis annua TaxID=3986 RepID=UPI00215DF2A5|nr:cucurbitadienol 11-hydroxylase-like [Mercurialis annua]
MAFVLFFIALFGLYCTIWINKWRNPNCKGVLPPGSMGLPFIGETLELIKPSYSLGTHPFIKKRIQRYGPIFRSNIAGRPIVISTDQEFNRYIINKEGTLVELWYLDTFSKIFSLEGESKINMSGYIHKFIRGALLSQLGTESLKTKLLPQIENLVTKTLYSWSNQDAVNVKDAVSTAICDFTAKLFCGYDDKGSPDKLSEMLKMFSGSLLAFPLNIPGTKYHKSLKAKEKVMKILRRKIMERRSSLVEREDGNEDFLDIALKQMEKDKIFTYDFIANLLFAFLFASLESISLTITLMLKFLLTHPQVLQDLMAEHESILQNRRPDSPIKWEEFKSMIYTQQVVNETLRFFNTLPGLLRKAIKDIQYKGYTIPAGWSIMAVVFERHMNPEVYKDPLVFNPARWKEFDSLTISKNFTPFGGGGMRQCVGADYTRVTMTLFLHVLVTKYKWTQIKEGKVVQFPLLELGKDLHVKLFEKQ